MTALSSLFNVEYGNKLDMNKMQAATKHEGIAFVGRKGGLGGHSGVSGYVSPQPGLEPYPAGLITVALGGSRLLSSYVQQRPFYTAQNVAVLSPLREDMSLMHRLYYAMCIRHNAFRYTAFGREANRSLSTLEMPEEVPAWVDSSALPTVDGLRATVAPEIAMSEPAAWKDFELQALFDVKKGKRVTKADRTPGPTRFIGASEKNNGVTDHCDLEPNYRAGSLTVAYNGNSVGFAFYQDEDFFACDDVNVLVPRSERSRWALLFVAASIRHERTRFTYGYKWTLGRMKTTTIRLPAAADGDPDWDYMERFMRGLPYSSTVVRAA